MRHFLPSLYGMLKHNVINNTNATSCVEDVRCSSVQALQFEMSVGDSERVDGEIIEICSLYFAVRGSY